MLNLTLATWDHDRAMPLHDGRVHIPGVQLHSTIAPTAKLFPLAVQKAQYDLTEMSISSYIMQLSRGTAEYTALPVFLSRAFRHGGFYARTGSGIRTLADFAGRRIGVPEYQMTAALWMRGIMADDFDVDCSKIHWHVGALETGVRRERLALNLPDGMLVDPIAKGDTLIELLLAGKIDGILAPKTPTIFLNGDRRLFRLFPDVEATEQAYHQRTGYFPIMHLVGLRTSLAKAHPWLPKAIYDGFVTARDIAISRLREVWMGNANRLTHPWFGASLERAIATMGADYWPYGYRVNQAELATICRYAQQQHLADRPVAPADLFARALLET